MRPLLFALLLTLPQVWRSEVAGFPKTGWLALTGTALVPGERLRFVPVSGDKDQVSVDAGKVDDPILLGWYPDILLLSSRAKTGKKVGEAARFDHAAC